ncbi:MAG: outer membrane beta-barrel protein [Bacteroidota bacterium]
MKHLKITLALFFVALAFGAAAQFNSGVNVGLVIPTGDMSDVLKLGFGGHINASYVIADHLPIGLNVGYEHFPGPSETVHGITVTSSATIVPVTAFLQYRITDSKVQPFLGSDFGMYLETAKATASGISASTSQTHFGIAPTLGVLISMSDQIALDVHGKYNMIFYSGGSDKYIGINVGIIIKGAKKKK